MAYGLRRLLAVCFYIWPLEGDYELGIFEKPQFRGRCGEGSLLLLGRPDASLRVCCDKHGPRYCDLWPRDYMREETGMTELSRAIDEAREAWNKRNGACSMCSAGDVPELGFHRRQFPCGKVSPSPKPERISAPAVCRSCGTVHTAPTTGLVMNECVLCGGVLAPTKCPLLARVANLENKITQIMPDVI
jgi:hypothetical protein